MFRAVALVVVALLVGVGAWLGRPDPRFFSEQIVRKKVLPDIEALVPSEKPAPLVRVAIDPTTPEIARNALTSREIEGVTWLPRDTATDADHVVHLALDSAPHSVTLTWSLDDDVARVASFRAWSILPPLLAIVCAIALRRVVLSLILGIIAGGIVAMWPVTHNPFAGAWHAASEYFLRKAVLGDFRLEVIGFVLLISGTVGVAQQAGGIAGLIEIIIRFCRTRRSARVGTVAAGMAIFFDDYLNCIIVGNALRPLTDRYGISRAKLAYFVDSTAAPIAGLSVVSTWIAFELMQIRDGLHNADLGIEPLQMFLSSLPYRFYCLLTLVFVMANAWMGRDFGPMLVAERKAAAGEGSGGQGGAGAVEHIGAPRARYAVLPIGMTLVGIMFGLWWTGSGKVGDDVLSGQGLMVYLQQVLGNANSTRSFFLASLGGFSLAWAMALLSGVLTARQALRASLISMRAISIAVVILLLAWSIGAACQDVGTASYLVALFKQVIRPEVFSLLVFAIAGLVAFATGSSYSTMAILLPNLVPLALAVGEQGGMGGIALVTMSVGAVLEGAIFGDHCSPISDTTILSALSSGCGLMEHVRTQLPYAAMTMAVAAVCGYVPVGQGVPVWVCLPVGAVVVVGLVRLVGKRTDGKVGSEK